MHFCLLVYCGKNSTNITKHLLGQHKEEYDNKEINRHQEISKQRKLLILKLSNVGDYKHNMEVIQSGSGTLVTWTKNQTTSSADDFLPCTDCLGFFHRKNLWRHMKVCPLCTTNTERSKTEQWLVTSLTRGNREITNLPKISIQNYQAKYGN